MNPKLYTNNGMIGLAQKLIAAQGGPESFQILNKANPVYANVLGKNGAITLGALRKQAATNPAAPALMMKNALQREALGDISQGVSLPQLAKLGVGAAKAHPLKALMYGGAGAANIGGLMDNDKLGGQLGGGALGYFASNALGVGNPILGALMGGALGAQFDKLRAQREASAQQAQQRMR